MAGGWVFLVCCRRHGTPAKLGAGDEHRRDVWGGRARRGCVRVPVLASQVRRAGGRAAGAAARRRGRRRGRAAGAGACGVGRGRRGGRAGGAAGGAGAGAGGGVTRGIAGRPPCGVDAAAYVHACGWSAHGPCIVVTGLLALRTLTCSEDHGAPPTRIAIRESRRTAPGEAAEKGGKGKQSAPTTHHQVRLRNRSSAVRTPRSTRSTHGAAVRSGPQPPRTLHASLLLAIAARGHHRHTRSPRRSPTQLGTLGHATGPAVGARHRGGGARRGDGAGLRPKRHGALGPDGSASVCARACGERPRGVAGGDARL